MNDTHYVNLTSNGPPETVLPPENENSIHALNDALKETSIQVVAKPFQK